MLRGLRNASSNWLGKTIMAAVVGFLVLSFVVWGIGDVFRGFGRSTVAKIGSTEITIEAFRTLYNDRLQQFSRQFGRPRDDLLLLGVGVELRWAKCIGWAGYRFCPGSAFATDGCVGQ